MHTKEIESKTGTELGEVMEAVNSRTREIYVVPPASLEMNEDDGWFGFGGQRFEATKLSARQIAKFADVPAGWTVKSQNDKVAKAINLGLQRSKTENVAITIEDDVIVSVLMEKHLSPSTDLIIPEAKDLMENRGFELQRWTSGEEGFTFRMTTESKKVEAREGDVVMGGVDFLCFENAKRGLEVNPLLFRLICSNGMVSGEFDEEASLVRGQAKPHTIVDQIRLCSMMVDVAIGQAERVLTAAHRLPEIKFDSEIIDQQIEEILRQFRVSPKLTGSIMESFHEENDDSAWGLVNAITSLARDEEDRMKAYRLESVGFRMVAYPSLVASVIDETHRY